MTPATGSRARCFSCTRESLGFTTSRAILNRAYVSRIPCIVHLGTSLPLPSFRRSHRSCQNPDAILADLASMLLSNLTSSSSACAALLSLEIQVIPLISATSHYPIQSRSGTCSAPLPYPSIDPQQVHALPLLVEAFAQAANSSPNPERKRKGDLHFLSSVFANVSSVSD